MADEAILWEGKPFNWGMPSFTKYTITDRRLIVETGVFTKKREEIRLYRIRDISLKRGLVERILSMGDIDIFSTDASTPNYLLRNIKDSIRVSDLLGEATENSRIKHHAQEFTEVQLPQ